MELVSVIDLCTGLDGQKILIVGVQIQPFIILVYAKKGDILLIEEEFSYSEFRSQNQSVGDSDPPLIEDH
jgi:hypothetical protein